ncbi:hypothetical protein, partial [Aeromonas caviae]|uniref:hypothetical protein n=1 Tax=Aeromonas caviae TaxID=648 RepID=UPI00301486F7
QTEYPWSACQKAPSVTVTWGWGSCGLMVDLGNSAEKTFTTPSGSIFTFIPGKNNKNSLLK